MSTHIESACSISHGGAAASLLDQTELDGGSAAEASTCKGMREAASTLHPSAGGRDEHAPCICLHLTRWSSRKLARSVGAAWRRCRRRGNHLHVQVQRTLSPSAPSIVEQLQACSISRSFMAALLQRQAPAGAWSKRQARRSPPECRRQRRACTLSPPASCTVKQPQACSTRRSFVAATLLHRRNREPHGIATAAPTARKLVI